MGEATEISYDQQINEAFESLLASMEAKMDEHDRRDIISAFHLARHAHKDQYRKSGEPYILHPIEVARICAQEIGLGPTAIVAALLHDVVEDTEVSHQDIEEQFNNKIAMIVDGLTKLDANITLAKNQMGSPQAENFKKVLRAMLTDVRVVLIKMADRLHNMRTLASMPRHKQLKIASETAFIYTPLAHRLGLYQVKTEFEDMTMKIMQPEEYFSVAKKLRETKRNREAYIASFINPLKQRLKEEVAYDIEIVGRPKSIFSIHNKISKKNVEFEEIYDLFAIRIIVEAPIKMEKAICWQIYSIVTDVHEPIPERLKDWITTPKSNGYESLHTTVVGPYGRYVEVQIRTRRMNEIAERGFAAHWKYKGALKSDNVYDRWLNSIRETLETQDDDDLDFLSDLKSNLFSDEVYVYTPKGDMKVLPKGATALDFAYSIHSEVGNTCAGVKLANKMVPLNYVLQNGDQLEVITNKSQKPTEDWLKFVQTARAKSKIRSSIKDRRKTLAGIGKETLLRKLQQLKLDYDENIEFLIDQLGYDNRIDFFLDIYNEKFDFKKFKNFDTQGRKFIKKRPSIFGKLVPFGRSDEQKDLKKRKSNPKKLKNSIIFPDNADFQYQFAPCCNPVPGDDIFGFINIGGGLKIHRVSCPNAEHLMANYGYRIIRTDWENEEEQTHIIEFEIKGVDTGPGVIQIMASKIGADLGYNIKSFYIDGNKGYFDGKITIELKSKSQIEDVIQNMKELEGIHSVKRI